MNILLWGDGPCMFLISVCSSVKLYVNLQSQKESYFQLHCAAFGQSLFPTSMSCRIVWMSPTGGDSTWRFHRRDLCFPCPPAHRRFDDLFLCTLLLRKPEKDASLELTVKVTNIHMDKYHEVLQKSSVSLNWNSWRKERSIRGTLMPHFASY